MKRFMFAAAIAGVAQFMVGCRGPSYDVPKFNPPQVPDPQIHDLIVCSKPEADQTFASDATPQSIEIALTMQDIEMIGCDGTVASRSHGAVGSEETGFRIEAPEGLAQQINYIELEAPRTCVSERVNATRKGGEGVRDLVLPDGRTIKMPAGFTSVGPTGAIYAVASSSNLRILNELNLAEGKNAVQVRYFGECAQLAPTKGDAELPTCVTKARLLATRNLVISLKVIRTEKPGVHRQSVCFK